MRHERQVELLRRLTAEDLQKPYPQANASMHNPASAYACPDRFQREMRALFRGGPVLFGLSCECPEPGGYLTGDIGGVSVLAVRQADGSLAGFVNACRHRAAPLVEGQGRIARSIVCPYHAWTYGTDGALLARPGTGTAFDDVEAAECSLHRVAIAERYGLIYVDVNPSRRPDIEAQLHGAGAEIGDFGLDRFVHVETRTAEWQMNWKLVLDTFTEAYHIPWLYKDSIAPFFLRDRMICDSFGPMPVAIGLRNEVMAEFEKPSEDDWALLPHATLQYFMLPHALLVYQIDHVELWRVTPLAVDRSRVSTSLFAPTAPETDKQRSYWQKNLDLLLQVTGTEDFPTMEAIQRNLSSGAVPEVVYGKNEPALIAFHSAIDAMLDEREPLPARAAE